MELPKGVCNQWLSGIPTIPAEAAKRIVPITDAGTERSISATLASSTGLRIGFDTS
jgi:hypothetical protein